MTFRKLLLFNNSMCHFEIAEYRSTQCCIATVGSAFRTGISSGGLSSSVKPTNWEIFWAGCAGGAAQLVVACPVDLAKIKLQVQTQTATTGEQGS